MAAPPTEPPVYPLKRNTLASTRLNYNHFWMKALTGYLLHPSIPTEKENLRVVDVGAGTGIWISELAGTLPNANFDAVDVSADQFPPTSIRPPNVSWWTHDCFQPFPAEYLGKFDVVNVRFWTCIINDDRSDALFQNVITLLKPGGYLSWFEPLPDSAEVHAPPGYGPTPACDQLADSWRKPTASSSYDWVNNLPQTFERNGIPVTAEDKYQNPKYLWPVQAQSENLGLSEYAYSSPSVADFQEALAKEHAAGVFVHVTWTCVVGRKLEAS
ncbi:S-adenosyl-L-methionine-dependent methyltransferase [Periconia macrospinosa]|uniref:S-adenosyl-L-methionine-dependent methyltransferase n=1 Tax=Periconia macrospinosa TaxID=97972 RepID=A0A2V1DGW8_9PLEO|nr:S-adenosyl-L-methionine-dependent methyltransferase [Periconia macrospinosa]